MEPSTTGARIPSNEMNVLPWAGRLPLGCGIDYAVLISHWTAILSWAVQFSYLTVIELLRSTLMVLFLNLLRILSGLPISLAFLEIRCFWDLLRFLLMWTPRNLKVFTLCIFVTPMCKRVQPLPCPWVGNHFLALVCINTVVLTLSLAICHLMHVVLSPPIVVLSVNLIILALLWQVMQSCIKSVYSRWLSSAGGSAHSSVLDFVLDVQLLGRPGPSNRCGCQY